MLFLASTLIDTQENSCIHSPGSSKMTRKPNTLFVISYLLLLAAVLDVQFSLIRFNLPQPASMVTTTTTCEFPVHMYFKLLRKLWGILCYLCQQLAPRPCCVGTLVEGARIALRAVFVLSVSAAPIMCCVERQLFVNLMPMTGSGVQPGCRVPNGRRKRSVAKAEAC